jgi:hypothetical protein
MSPTGPVPPAKEEWTPLSRLNRGEPPIINASESERETMENEKFREAYGYIESREPGFGQVETVKRD